MQSKGNKIISFLVFSILLHLLFLFLLKENWQAFEENQAPEKIATWVTLQQPPDIVDVPKPKKEEVPDKPTAQGLYTQKVKEETVAPSIPQKKSTVDSRQSTAQQESKTTSEPQNVRTSAQKFKDLYATQSPVQGENQKQAPQPNAVPDYGSPFSSNEFLPAYKVGNTTYLNILANPQIAYYVELKQKFKLAWNPIPTLRGHVSEISKGKIDVVIGFTILQDGTLTGLRVIQASSLPTYDYEGKRTVQVSAPFSAPPQHLLGSADRLNLAVSFVVYL